MGSHTLAKPPLVISGALAAVVAALLLVLLLLVLLLLVRRRARRRRAATAASAPEPTLAPVAGGHSTSSALGRTYQAAALAGRRLSVVIPCYNEYENIRPMYQRLTALPERDCFIRGLRGWGGCRQTGIPCVGDDRKFGKTSNSILELFRWAGRGISSFSYAPL